MSSYKDSRPDVKLRHFMLPRGEHIPYKKEINTYKTNDSEDDQLTAVVFIAEITTVVVAVTVPCVGNTLAVCTLELIHLAH